MQPTQLPSGCHFFERGWLSSNSLLVHNTDHSAVFDTGYLTHAEQLADLIRSTIGSQPLDLIVNSHLHSDHCGGNRVLQQTYGDVMVAIPGHQFAAVSEWEPSSLTYEVTGQQCFPFNPTHALAEGTVLSTGDYSWQVLSAPGHDNDEFIFYEPNHEILFSADALWENGLGVVFPEFLGGVGFENVASTLDMLAALKCKLVLPGHGAMFYDMTTAISNARLRLDQFAKHPEKHAIYSAKVLLKFKLLAAQTLPLSEFMNWAADIDMLELIHQRFFTTKLKQTWLLELAEELVHRNAASVSDNLINNI
jgi:glyoxylase-like metal-dependent hydrolase (beta-lactamase superfamily II)